MRKAREFSPGRKEGRGCVEGRHMIPSVGDSLDFASKKEDKMNSYNPMTIHVCST